MGLLNFIAEQARAERTQDDKYLRSLTYFFELRIPESVANGGPTTLIYPLIIPPDNYHLGEPFALEKTFTNRSGLWVEENGIIARELTLSGTTGWRPRKFPNGYVTAAGESVKLPSEGRSFSRVVKYSILDELSGQRHFQFLQDAVFRTYGDLKADPSTAEDTELFFHNPKEDEHWRVHPMTFDTDRTANSQNIYRYNIVLLCSEGATARTLSATEDFDVLETLKNVNLMLNYGVSLINGGLTDVSGIQDELRRNVQGIATILEDVAALSTAVLSFLQGTARFIAIPYATTLSILNGLDTVLAAAFQAFDLGTNPDVDGSVLNSLRKLGDGVAAIASYPEKFRTSIDDKIAEFQEAQGASNAEEEAADQIPATLRDFGLLGTSPLPGDFIRAVNRLGLGSALPRFQSAVERIVESGDTLPNLAARYLGDARLWRYLAVFNDLSSPYISDSGLPRTLGVGDVILIPSTARPAEARGSPNVLGVPLDAPAEERTLGTDFLLKDQGRGFYDWEIDVEGGSIDVRLVSGVANLSQGLRSRLITNRGEDTLYKTLGVGRVVGLGITVVDLESAQIRLLEGVQADPRVNGVRAIEFQNGPPDDAVYVEMDVEVRGMQRSERITIRQ